MKLHSNERLFTFINKALQFYADLFTFTKEILNAKHHFFTVYIVTVYCKSKKLTSGFTTSKLVSYNT